MAGRGRRRYGAGERHVLPHLHGTPVGPHVVEDLRVPDDADTSAAQWLSDTFGKTEVSFLRNGALGTTSAGTPTTCRKQGSGGEEGVEDDGSDEEGSEESTAADGSEGDGSVLTEDAEGGQTLIEEDKTVASIGTNITVRTKRLSTAKTTTPCAIRASSRSTVATTS